MGSGFSRILGGESRWPRSSVRGAGLQPCQPYTVAMNSYRLARALAAAGVACACALVAAAAQPAPAPGTIAQLAWLAGTWKGGSGALAFEERWTPPSGGAMLAVSRTVEGERMVAFEFLRIVERDGGLVYIAQPNGRPPTEFTLSAITADAATFENPSHDFPKVIRYARRPDGALEARVSDGAQRAETFVFRRSD